MRVAALARLCSQAPRTISAACSPPPSARTPGQYVLERRVALAAQRLALSADAIDEVASTCGFPDRFYFSRVFAKRMGAPPAAYRKRQLSGPNQQ